MEWTKYTIRTTIESEDLVSAMLLGLGVEGIEIENALPPTDDEFEAMFIDPEPELLPDETSAIEEGISLVSFYIRVRENSAEAAEGGDSLRSGSVDDTVDDSYTIHDKEWSLPELMKLLSSIEKNLDEMRAYANIGEGSISTESSREDDWRNNWKDYFKPQVMENLIIKPTWAEIPSEHEAAVTSGEMKVIEMDPGTAFGTGGHETTRLCVKGLAKYLKPGQTVLDIGTGSGILGLCALSMGASYIMATELDPDCEHIVNENLELNGVTSDLFELSIGNIADDEAVRSVASKRAPYDIIVSNILAPVIATLAGEGQADTFAKEGSFFITSGIIDTREEEVLEAFRSNPNWEILESVHMGEWVSIVAKKN